MTPPALTLTQPWASLVAAGAKQIETRSWATAHRGVLLIHAAKTFGGVKGIRDPATGRPLPGTRRGYERLCQAVLPGPLERAGLTEPDGLLGARTVRDLPLGAIVAACRLEGCVAYDTNWAADVLRRRLDWADHDGEPNDERQLGGYGPGRYCWLLRDVHTFDEPIPCDGHQQLWQPPDDVADVALAKLVAAGWLK
jgi:activating signal cointegrator 1